MSLDIYLTQKEKTMKTCDHCNSEYEAEGEELYSANITHNLGSMAEEAGIYKHLWRPEELGITTAKELIEPLKAGLQLLKDKPEHFEKFNATNGWGLYKHFVPFVEKYLNACEEYPEAQIGVSR
jgi:hypothetical protein